MPNAATENGHDLDPAKKLGDKDPQHFDPDESIGDVIGRILSDGRELAVAEVLLFRAKALSEALSYKGVALLLGTAFVVAMGGMVAFFWGIAAAFATIVGPLAGGAIAAILAIAVAAALVLVAKSKMESIQ